MSWYNTLHVFIFCVFNLLMVYVVNTVISIIEIYSLQINKENIFNVVLFLSGLYAYESIYFPKYLSVPDGDKVDVY